MGTKEAHQPYDLGSLTDVVADDPADRRHRMIAVVAAVAIHAALLSLNIPISADPLPVPERLPEDRILVLHRFTPPPPPPPQERLEPLREEAARPIPVPAERAPEIVHRRTEPVEFPVFHPTDDTHHVYQPPAPAPTPAPPATIRAFTPPRILTRVEPDYPAAALHAGVQGTVILEMTIDERGTPIDVQVLRPQPFGLTQAAVNAAQQWRFEPCTSDGRPVRVQFTLTVRFNRK
jgi:protein TonB